MDLLLIQFLDFNTLLYIFQGCQEKVELKYVCMKTGTHESHEEEAMDVDPHPENEDAGN